MFLMTWPPQYPTLWMTGAVLGFSLVWFCRWLQSGRCRCRVRLDGKTVIVTGANSGIGKETARELARRGARVILACRNMARALAAARDIEADSTGEIVVRQLDLASLKSVREFAEQIISTEKEVNLLINNAGLMCAKSTTEEGFDTQFCTNHMGPFLLTNLLLEKIKSSAPARVINVSSSIHASGQIYWDDLNMAQPGNYNAIYMYCQSKLANILFSKELARRLIGTGVNVYSLHPGAVKTAFQGNLVEKGLSPPMTAVINFTLRYLPFLWKSAEEGAQTTIYCAVSEEVAHHTGLYYSDCALKSPAYQTRDPEVAKKLWDASLRLVGLTE